MDVEKNLSHLHVISISTLCTDGKGFRSRVSGTYEITVCHLAVNNPGCRQAVTIWRINSFQTHFFIIIKWPNIGHETSATLPFHVWSSYSMSCLKQPTTNGGVEIRETSWAAALFAVVISSLMTSQRRLGTIREWRVYPRSEWCVYKFWAKQHTHTLSFLFRIYRSLISLSSKVFCHIGCVNQNWMCCNWRQRSQICVGIVAMATPQYAFMTSHRVGVHSFESRPNEAGAVYLGKQWRGPIHRHGRLAEFYLVKYKSVSLCIHWHCIGLVSNHWNPLLW